LVADIMTNETPLALDVLTAFRNKSADMARGSLETVVTGNPFNTGVGPSTALKKRRRGKGGTLPLPPDQSMALHNDPSSFSNSARDPLAAEGSSNRSYH